MTKKLLVAVAFSAALFTGCTSTGTTPTPAPTVIAGGYDTATPAKVEAYHNDLRKVAVRIRNNPNYNKIERKTAEEKKWFNDLMYRYWNRDITKTQFISEGLTQYPAHKNEFVFIADSFQSI